MNRLEKLQHLRRVIEGVKAERKAFNMHWWGIPVSYTHQSLNPTSIWGDPRCGTACCALGYAAFDPTFRDMGLVACSYTSYDREELASPKEITDHIGVEFDGWSGFDAARFFFEITRQEVDFLFDPTSYPEDEMPVEDVYVLVMEHESWPDRDTPITPDEVISHIDYLIDRYSN